MIELCRGFAITAVLMALIVPAEAAKHDLQTMIRKIQKCKEMSLECVNKATGARLHSIRHFDESEVFEARSVRVANYRFEKITLTLPIPGNASKFGPRLVMSIDSPCIDKLNAAYDYNLPFAYYSDRNDEGLPAKPRPSAYFVYGNNNSPCFQLLVIEREAGKP